MKFTLDQKIFTGFASATIILIVIGFVSFRNSEKFIDTNQWVNHTHEVLYEFEQVLVTEVDAETGMRGFVITGNENFLEPYNRAKQNMQEHMDKVRELTIDNPTQQRNLKILQRQVEEHMAHLDTCILLRKKDFQLAQARVASGKGKKIMDGIRQTIDDSKNSELKLLEDRRESSEGDARDFNFVFIVLIIGIVVVLISVYLVITSNLRALRRAEKETADKNWNLTGTGELTKGMQGNKHLMELGQVIITHLATYLDVQIGAIYIADESGTYFRLANGYALTNNKKEGRQIRLGEGFIGQAAFEKRMLELTEIPADYFVIDTGLGEILPKYMLIIPVLYENRVVGVVELGSMKPFTELQRYYLEMTMDSVAIAITSAQSREKVKELLEETQRQTEELESQQEELKQFNEELQVKTELLEKSEAELRSQQEELHQSNEELEEKANLLEEQKETLENAKLQIETKAQELELSSRYKSEFLANMSHELRTPLNSILILSQLLADNKNKTLNDKEIEFATNICNSGTDLLNLINEILDLSKVESGKLDLEISEVPIKKIKSGLMAMFEEVAKKKSIHFDIQYNEQALQPSIRTDQQRLEQIIRNLLSNAFKFTDNKGSVTLKIEQPSANTILRDKNLDPVHCIAFSVTDTGIGIPEDKQQIIFEAFQQVDGSTKRKYGGTGLGLSISRELALALGGEIHVQSTEGKGSTFTLFIPQEFNQDAIVSEERAVEIKKSNAAAEEIKATLPSAKSEPVFIEETEDVPDDRYNISENDKVALLMEDDVVFAKLMLDFLRERNYKGIIATRGNTGLSYARHYKPDAIILDMKLPVMDGAEVLKQLKNDPTLRHIPVQVISGYDRKREGLELGAFDFIRKPVTKNILLGAFDKIEEFVRKKLKKLLIVEDNETQNTAIRELVGNGDVKSFSAYSGKDAYEMLLNDSFDCIIVDLGLPDMSGFDLLEKIKENATINHIPIIVYTGRDLTKDEKNKLNKLASTVVLKTADSQERLLDETTLFLHRVESKLPKEKQRIIRKLHKTEEILKYKKVLVVDDDIRNVYSLTNALEEENMICYIAENGKVALKVLAENPSIDIVLMDVMMPEMDGYEATREIRNIESFDKIPIIAITAKAMKGDREKCLAAGMSDYISKPVNMEQLLSLMRVWLYN